MDEALAANSDNRGQGDQPSAWRRFAPLAIIAIGLAAFFAFGLDEYVRFSLLRDHHETLTRSVAENAVLASLVMIVVYAVVIAFSIPGGALLTITAGFLFGTVWGGLLVLVGATLGATGIFLAARTAIGDLLRRKAGPWMARLEDGFRENAFNYLLSLRLIPVLPFWLVNIVPAFFGVSLGVFVTATLLGIIPGTFVFAAVGNGLGATLESGGEPDFGMFLKPELLLPMLALAVLVLVPTLYKKFKSKRH